jgi:hypothetical protein
LTFSIISAAAVFVLSSGYNLKAVAPAERLALPGSLGNPVMSSSVADAPFFRRVLAGLVLATVFSGASALYAFIAAAPPP